MIVLLLYSSMGLYSWKLSDYHSHIEELQILLVDHKPLFLCLQETHLLPEDNPCRGGLVNVLTGYARRALMYSFQSFRSSSISFTVSTILLSSLFHWPFLHAERPPLHLHYHHFYSHLSLVFFPF